MKQTDLVRIAVLTALLASGAGKARAEDNAPGITGVEAVSSKVAPDYVRAKAADGSYVPEYYSFGKGGNWGGEFKDDTIDKLSFIDIAKGVAPSLQAQKYLPASDPKVTKLLIMVYWGTTAVPLPYDEDPLYRAYSNALEESQILLSGVPPQVEESDDVLSSGMHELNIANGIRDRLDFKNASMLGYDAGGVVGTDRGKYLSHTAFKNEGNDQLEEIEQNRYFIVLMAYDFQLLWKTKKHKLLWEARFSISQKHNQFDKALSSMTQYASKYFGQPTNGLVRQRLLDAHVEIGDPTLIQFLGDEKKK
ncbi:MAG TPA: hypothetical protein VFE25_03795 [Opitutaceae bacterium]|jgi:hypothetical protein|nr:hypothetical protein [Opitutaceae bacterium]